MSFCKLCDGACTQLHNDYANLVVLVASTDWADFWLSRARPTTPRVTQWSCNIVVGGFLALGRDPLLPELPSSHVTSCTVHIQLTSHTRHVPLSLADTRGDAEPEANGTSRNAMYCPAPSSVVYRGRLQVATPVHFRSSAPADGDASALERRPAGGWRGA